MKTLLSMRAFVVLMGHRYPADKSFAFMMCQMYEEFLGRILELGMFVPCVDGVPIDEPREENYRRDLPLGEETYLLEVERYQEAKEKVLFVFEDKEEMQQIVNALEILSKSQILIEQLITEFWVEPNLTKSALKQLGI